MYNAVSSIFSTRHRAGLTALSIFMAIISLFILLATRFPQLYILATYEDLPGEWAQFFFFSITLILCLKLSQTRHPHRIFFGVLGIACFYVVGEEISWGQRLFAFTTPEFFQRHNLQQELNLHNFLTGPVATGRKRIIEVILILGLIGYGLIYPLLHRQHNKLAGFIHDKGIPVPPLYLSPYFIVAGLCEGRFLSFNEAEIAELLIGIALAFLCLHYYYNLPSNQQSSITDHRIAVAMLSILMLSTACAGGISWYSWHNETIQHHTQKRITAGQKKFATRYMRVGQYDHAVDLYKKVLSKQPKNTEILRQLALCYTSLGHDTISYATNQKAINIDMARYGRNPQRIATNLSLSKSYQQIGNGKQAQIHSSKALLLGKDKATLEPYNASSHYWYGKALQANGFNATAQKQFAKAVTMKPASKKYQQAYRKNKGKMLIY